MSDSLWPHGLYSPWNSLGLNTGVGSLSLLQGIFPTQGSNWGLLHCRRFFTTWAIREAHNDHDVVSADVLLAAQMVKNLPAMQEIQETQVQSLGWEDPLEKGKATHSSILAWRVLWTEESGGLQSMGSRRVGHDWATNTSTCTFIVFHTAVACNHTQPWRGALHIAVG